MVFIFGYGAAAHSGGGGEDAVLLHNLPLIKYIKSQRSILLDPLHF